MDLDIEQYNYAINANLEYSMRTIAGVCTQIIDTPVTRSSMLYENRFLLKLPDETEIDLESSRRRDISIYLENAPNNGIPNKLRGIPILFGVTLISHLSAYLLDIILPSKNTDNNNNEETKEYVYSISMHLYNKCKLQNMSINNIANNQVMDANMANNMDNGGIAGYQHNWNHDGLIRKIVISSLCSLLTFPLYSIYTRIAFDIGEISKNGDNNNNGNIVKYKYAINGFCSNIISIGKQMISEENDKNNNTTFNIFKLYNGYSIHLIHNILYQLFVHYSRELLIEISPKIHNNRFINRYLSKKHDPFEYSMFCIWWIPPVICRALCYPLIKMQNKCILNEINLLSISSLNGLNVIPLNMNIGKLIKTTFDGVIGNTTRFMTEIQMAELFGLWSLIRFAHKTQYKQLIFEQQHNECTICYGDKGRADIVFVPCGHKFCKSDAYDVISRNMNCPQCRRPIQNSFTDLGKWKKLFML